MLLSQPFQYNIDMGKSSNHPQIPNPEVILAEFAAHHCHKFTE